MISLQEIRDNEMDVYKSNIEEAFNNLMNAEGEEDGEFWKSMAHRFVGQKEGWQRGISIAEKINTRLLEEQQSRKEFEKNILDTKNMIPIEYLKTVAEECIARYKREDYEYEDDTDAEKIQRKLEVANKMEGMNYFLTKAGIK